MSNLKTTPADMLRTAENNRAAFDAQLVAASRATISKHAQRTIRRAKARHRRMSRNVDAIAAERVAVERIKP